MSHLNFLSDEELLGSTTVKVINPSRMERWLTTHGMSSYPTESEEDSFSGMSTHLHPCYYGSSCVKKDRSFNERIFYYFKQ